MITNVAGKEGWRRSNQSWDVHCNSKRPKRKRIGWRNTKCNCKL